MSIKTSKLALATLALTFATFAAAPKAHAQIGICILGIGNGCGSGSGSGSGSSDAPEIDASTLGTGFALVAGSAAIIRSRRRRAQLTATEQA